MRSSDATRTSTTVRGFKLAKPSFASLISAHESAFTVYFTIVVVVVVVVVAVCRRLFVIQFWVQFRAMRPR